MTNNAWKTWKESLKCNFEIKHILIEYNGSINTSDFILKLLLTIIVHLIIFQL